PVPAVAELVVVGGQVDREADDRAVVGDVAPLVLANVGEVGPLVDVVAGQVGGQVGEGAVADGTGRLRRVHQLHDVGQVAPCQQGRQAFVIVGGRSDLRPVVDVQPLVVRLPEHVLLQRWGGRVPADLELGDRAAVTRWGIDGPEQLVGSLGVARGHPVDVGDDRSLDLRRGRVVGQFEPGGVVDGDAAAGGVATGARSECRQWRSTAGG